jgi:hypothetical protein
MKRPTILFKEKVRFLFFILAFMLFSLIFSSCMVEEPLPDDSADFTGVTEKFPLIGDNSSAFGSIVFRERKDGTSLIRIELNNIQNSSGLKAQINSNTYVDGGEQIVVLKSISAGANGENTHVTSTKAGEKISFRDLLNFNGHALVINEAGEPVLKGDIGQNALTGNVKSYNLNAEDGSVNFTFTFSERRNGKSFATVETKNGGENDTYRPFLYANPSYSKGSLIAALPEINPSRSINRFNLNKDDNSFDFEQLMRKDAHIRIYKNSELEESLIVAKDIFGNELTGKSHNVQIKPMNNSGITGEMTISERMSGNSMISIKIDDSSIVSKLYGGVFIKSGEELSKWADLNYIQFGISVSELRNNVNGIDLPYKSLVANENAVILISRDSEHYEKLASGNILSQP